MLKNATLYRASLPQVGAFPNHQALERDCFQPCGPTQAQSCGWVPARGTEHAALIEAIGQHQFLRLRTELRRVPGDAVKHSLEGKCKAIEQETGRRPKGRRLKELREEVVQALMPQAFTRIAETLIWLDTSSGLAMVGATGARADTAVTHLLASVPGLRVDRVQYVASPATRMACWLLEDAPSGFTVDRDCELSMPDSEKAAVRYTRHNLDRDEIRQHLKEGKLVRSLALTWNGRVSFVLDDRGHLRKLQLLNVVLDSAKGSAGDPGAGFDTDAALFAGEMSRALPDLIEAMGGLLQADEQAEDTTPAESVAARQVAELAA
jgi:recombination associated protein RdgC